MRPSLGSHRRERPLWIAEFDESYGVPDCIAQAEGLRDTSWHNNTCPSFDVSLGHLEHSLCIWVEHPEIEQRENPYSGPRFMIEFADYGKFGDDAPFGKQTDTCAILFETEDETLVVPAYLKFLKQYRDWRDSK